jgi:hypothetical protein
MCRIPSGLSSTPNQWFPVARPVSARGALRDRHGRWERDAMDAACQETNDVVADGEVVWSWRPDAGAKWAERSADDGGKRARSPGRARISRKTIAQGMPVVCGVPVVATRVLSCCTRGYGCIEHPAFSAPSYFDEGGCFEKLGHVMPRECGLTSFTSSLRTQGPTATGWRCRTKLWPQPAQNDPPAVMGPCFSQGRRSGCCSRVQKPCAESQKKGRRGERRPPTSGKDDANPARSA